jgi:hypothetical protein
MFQLTEEFFHFKGTGFTRMSEHKAFRTVRTSFGYTPTLLGLDLQWF